MDFGVLFVAFVSFWFWLPWVFAAAHRLSLAVVNVSYGERASHCREIASPVAGQWLEARGLQ